MKTEFLTLTSPLTYEIGSVMASRFEELNKVHVRSLKNSPLLSHISNLFYLKTYIWDFVDSSIERIVWLDADIWPIAALSALPQTAFAARRIPQSWIKAPDDADSPDLGFFCCTRESKPAFDELKQSRSDTPGSLRRTMKMLLNKHGIATQVLTRDWLWEFCEGMPPPDNVKMVHYGGMSPKSEYFGRFENAVVLPRVIDYRSTSRSNPTWSSGMGDTLAGLAYVQGLARKYPDKRVRYKIADKNVSWAKLGWHDVSIEGDGTKGEFEAWGINVDNHECDLQALSYHRTRQQEIARRLDIVETIGKFEIQQPSAAALESVNRAIGSDQRPIIILAPFSNSLQRTWPMTHWIELQRMLSEAAVHTVAIDGLEGDKTLRDMPGTVLWGANAEQSVALFKQASLVCTNDSGPAHLAGILGVPTIAICAPTLGNVALGSYSTVHVLQAPGPCSGCYWQYGRGFRYACKWGCEIMWDVKPKTVAAMILKAIRK
ncbi:MAG TPA: glycosyltransferase family 9 protein [Planctomycetota bacterium]|nr:glycosyltransferase family 9 protein [Planctomycetota bacterium]